MGSIYNVPIREALSPISDTRVNRDGKIIHRYNIVTAEVEYYFIPAEYIEEYENAHFKQDLNAHKKFGTQLIVSAN